MQDGRISIAKDGIKHFAGDLPEAEQQVLWATQTAPAAELLTAAKMGKPARKSRPRWYIVAKQTKQSILTASDSWRSAWARRLSKPARATS
jgi:hypothetical protein